MSDSASNGRQLSREALYEFAKTAWEAENQRFVAVEEKADRYVALTFAAIGAGSFGVEPVLSAVQAGSRIGGWHLLAGFAFVAALGSLIVAALNGLRAQAPGKLKGLPTSAIEAHFESATYEVALLGMSRAFLRAATHNRATVKAKHDAARSCFHALTIGFAFGVVGLVASGLVANN